MAKSSSPFNSNHSARSPFSVSIELDRPIYNPGDVVAGQILLELDRPLVCDQLTARLFGSARVFFTKLLKTPGNFGKTRAYEQEIVLVDKVNELWAAEGRREGDAEEIKNNSTNAKSLEEILRQCNPNAIRLGGGGRGMAGTAAGPQEGGKRTDGGNGLGQGRHEFSFAFKLPPDGLFTSFDAESAAGSLRYYILVQASKEGFASLKRKLLFPVVCLQRLDSPRLMPLALEPISEQGSDKKELLKVNLKLDKRGYVPGEPLQGTIRIENNTLKSVKWMSLRIVQQTTCYATRPEFAVHQSQFETAGMGLPVRKIAPSETAAFPIRFFVPALVPALNVPGCIESSHQLRLNVANKRGVAVELNSPLLIGTHPTVPIPRYVVQNGSSSSFSSSEDLKVIMPPAAAQPMLPPPPNTAPPLYEENGTADSILLLEDVPPPSYAQSVAGMSDLLTGVQQDEGGGEGGGNGTGKDGTTTVQQPYGGPVCYLYTFGNQQEGPAAEGASAQRQLVHRRAAAEKDADEKKL